MRKQLFDAGNKGKNVTISDGVTARRRSGFSDGVVLSEFYVKPGELVAVEILETQPCWNGELRVGFTLLPDHALTPLPSFTLPELFARGQSWIFPVGIAAAMLVSHRHRSYWRRQQQLRRSMRRGEARAAAELANDLPDSEVSASTVGSLPLSGIRPFQVIEPNSALCFCCLHTALGRVAFSRLTLSRTPGIRSHNAEKGSIVAIYYEMEQPPSHIPFPVVSSVDLPSEIYSNASGQTTQHFRIRFHIVLNGVDLVTVSEQIPINDDQIQTPEHQTKNSRCDGPNSLSQSFPKFKAIFDIYGQTKAIQLVQLNQTSIPLLSRLCSCTILNVILRHHYYGSTSKSSAKTVTNTKSSSDTFRNGMDQTTSYLRLSHLASDLMANMKIQHLLNVLHSLPLPRSARQELQLDALGVITRELQSSPVYD